MGGHGREDKWHQNFSYASGLNNNTTQLPMLW